LLNFLAARNELQAAVDMLDELELEHRKLSQLADKARQLRAQNAQMAQEVSRLPELKKAASELQQQVVELQHVKQQIQRLQVRCSAWGMHVMQNSTSSIQCTAVLQVSYDAFAAAGVPVLEYRAHCLSTPFML
jgi:DNA repair exonuclease SbcCD ATPase subunit